MEEKRGIIKTSIAHFDKKRKLEDQMSDMPSLKKAQYDAIQSWQEFTGSNSFNLNTENDELKTDLQYSDFPTSISSSSSSAAASSEFSLFFSDTKSLTNTSFGEEELMSINEQPECSTSGFSFTEHEKSGDEQECLDTELEDLLCSNGVAQSSSSYILLSGRRLVNQDSQQESKKLTIDKEFEQYFSKLML